jgi:hypothetical protein
MTIAGDSGLDMSKLTAAAADMLLHFHMLSSARLASDTATPS